MARLHEASDDDDELPDLSTLLNAARSKPREVQTSRSSPRKAQWTTPVHRTKNTDDESARNMTTPLSLSENVLETASNDSQARLQKPLRLAHVNSLLLPTLHSKAAPIKSPRKLQAAVSVVEIEKNGNGRGVRDTPKRRAAPKVDFRAFAEDLRTALQQEGKREAEKEEEKGADDELSDFIVSDDASEEELRRPRGVGRSWKKLQSRRVDGSRLENDGLEGNPKLRSAVIDLTSPEKAIETTASRKPRPQAPSQEDFTEDPGANLKFSPPHSRSPRRKADSPRKPPSTIRPLTPPTSPSKPRLQSPSKSTHARIPPSPHRPSLDAFWSASDINDWNETYSPSKSPIRRQLFPVPEDDESVPAPKSPSKSPAKTDKAARAQQKAFDASKHALAEAFLTEVDDTVAAGQVAALAASTGGVKLVWSKKLTSTAGRAIWRREALRPSTTSTSTVPVSVPTPTPPHRHHATIELSLKIITTTPRLLNVLAHEYCHLANFMLSGVKDAPHGASFQTWARTVSLAFAARGVQVTTRHGYEIAYKYRWACGGCGLEYQRHSRSIDVARQVCGGCKGGLVQVVPAPRGTGGAGEGGGEGGVTGGGFQAFVKAHYARVKREEAGWGMGEVMARLGREFREEKGRAVAMATAKAPVEGVEGREGVEVEVVGVVEVGSERDREEVEGGGDRGGMAGNGDGELDRVARKLEFLNL